MKIYDLMIILLPEMGPILIGAISLLRPLFLASIYILEYQDFFIQPEKNRVELNSSWSSTND